ncbi:hypothetical protein C2S53_009134 [Perilla frutescens var. hirtella]|uniref:Protein kinase domain-containing protein n=1 Tax=Perilla frutescens var. hirtella TaxID=608512 RepID=A0AAD4INB3_PERFH|nr:hypothetical protein C2S53_009134 [Perilla frutescens var. hirtella]
MTATVMAMKDGFGDDIYNRRKRAIKTMAVRVRGTTILKKEKGFRFSDYRRGRKVACKSKAAPPTSTNYDDIIKIRFIFRKRKREHSPPPSQDLKLDSNLLRFQSVTMAAADSEARRRQIEMSITRLCKSEGAIRGCGRFDDYEKLDGINRGAYGAVYLARHRRSGEIVAVKEDFEGVSIPTLREIDILNSLPPHPSIVGFKGAVADHSGDLYIVMEHVDHDLRGYMEVVPDLRQSEIKNLMKQVLEGVKFLHDNMVMHRDIKPSNILVSRWGVVKICDFGLSRRLEAAGGRYSPDVGTPGYRAPELLLGETAYSMAVDMWGVGCVMAEMFSNRVLFKGSGTQSGQLETIYGILGINGGGDDQTAAASNLLRNKICNAEVTEAGFDLLSRLLCCDPTKRITAEAAINHQWFDEL